MEIEPFSEAGGTWSSTIDRMIRSDGFPVWWRRGEKAMMEYKGYLAAVEFDDSADVLHGRVVNSGPYPIAAFESTDARQLRREFERSVDEYLEWCEEDGVEPRKPFPGKFNVRLGSELHVAVVSAAPRRSE